MHSLLFNGESQTQMRVQDLPKPNVSEKNLYTSYFMPIYNTKSLLIESLKMYTDS